MTQIHEANPHNPKTTRGLTFAGACASVAATLASAAVAGATPAGASAATRALGHGAAKVPITLWTLSSNPGFQKLESQAINDFNKSYPGGDVQVDYVENDAYKTKIAVAMSAHHPPTIFFTWGGRVFDAWAQAGQVMPITSQLNSDPAWKNSYLPTAWDLISYNGQIYGVPESGPGIELMFANQAVLAKAGVHSAPSSWAQFVQAAQAVKKTGAFPIALAGATEWPEMIWLQYLTLRYGGPQVFNNIADGKPGAWDNPAVLKACEQVQTLARDGFFETGYSAVHWSSGETDELMAAGKAAFQAMGDWDYSSMLNVAPKFANSPNYKFATFPAVPGSAYDSAIVGEPATYYSIAANASPAQKKEALAFLKDVTTSRAWNVSYLEATGQTPDDVHFAGDLVHFPGGKELLTFFRMAQHATYLQDYWDQNLPPAVVTPMLTDIGELFDLSITPQKFVQDLDSVLAKNS
jgi:ABC-type glycerol-3-phosphate transport system substrate-binding protein